MTGAREGLNRRWVCSENRCAVGEGSGKVEVKNSWLGENVSCFMFIR